MRPLFLNPLMAAAAAAATTATLAACVSQGERDVASYSAEVDQLRADCAARGGTLIPTGRISGNAALDNPCRIREASAIPRG